jgi:cardiolipin synthase
VAFVVVAFSSDDGTGVTQFVLFAIVAWGDYADGIAARVTGQYSRMGAMLDPVVDRLLVICGVVVCWHFDLVPRWLLALLIAREALMLLLAPFALRRGVELKINWWGRWGVWPAMSSLFFAICGLRTLARALLAVGVTLLIVATVEYARSARRQLAA